MLRRWRRFAGWVLFAMMLVNGLWFAEMGWVCQSTVWSPADDPCRWGVKGGWVEWVLGLMLVGIWVWCLEENRRAQMRKKTSLQEVGK